MIIFWDFNGTILDDLDLCFNILNDMLIRHDRRTITKDKYLEIFTFPIIDYYAQVFDLEKTPFDMLAKEFITAYQGESLNLKLMDGFEESYQYFRSKGYQQVVLSASQIDNLHEQLRHYKIDNYFDDVLGISDIHAKSKVLIGKDYVTSNQVDKTKALMIGDTIHDYQVAQEMGIKCLVYTGGHQAKERLKEFDHVDHLREIKKRGY